MATLVGSVGLIAVAPAAGADDGSDGLDAVAVPPTVTATDSSSPVDSVTDGDNAGDVRDVLTTVDDTAEDLGGTLESNTGLGGITDTIQELPDLTDDEPEPLAGSGSKNGAASPDQLHSPDSQTQSDGTVARRSNPQNEPSFATVPTAAVGVAPPLGRSVVEAIAAAAVDLTVPLLMAAIIGIYLLTTASRHSEAGREVGVAAGDTLLTFDRPRRR
ncbi:MAG TPA: hypothetical protein VGA13_06770 [Acidimicrobiales bacterium]